MDDLVDQVQSLFYCDVHFNSVNTRMYTKPECDTGVDGNLMPITMFAKLLPKLSLNMLEKTVEKDVTL